MILCIPREYQLYLNKDNDGIGAGRAPDRAISSPHRGAKKQIRRFSTSFSGSAFYLLAHLTLLTWKLLLLFR